MPMRQAQAAANVASSPLVFVGSMGEGGDGGVWRYKKWHTTAMEIVALQKKMGTGGRVESGTSKAAPCRKKCQASRYTLVLVGALSDGNRHQGSRRVVFSCPADDLPS